MSAVFLLIRHGQIRANRDGCWHGAIDSPLTQIGRLQAKRVARRLRANFDALDAIYSSPLLRCRATAQPIAAVFDRPVVLDDDLREYSIGELEGTPFKALHDQYDFFARIHDLHYRPRGGESLGSVAERMVRALRRIEAQSQNAARVAIVGHGAALAIALASLLDDDPKRWTNYAFSNGSITELTLAPTPAVPSFNRTDHL
jgi:broad specificity phosphatase PhoE